jgi:hypothetical protein
MKHVVLLVLVAACAKSKQDKRAADRPEPTGGAVGGAEAPGAPAPPPPPAPVATGSATPAEMQQHAKQQGVLGSTTSSDGEAFANLEGGSAAIGDARGSGPVTGRRVDKIPSMTIGAGTVKGALDKALIRRYMRRHQQKFVYCYEKELAANPTLEGSLAVSFTIGIDGKVTSATAKGVHANVEVCVARMIQQIEFPQPAKGEVKVEYPLKFAPR